MASLRERQEFAPPPTPGLVRAVLLAILAHGILLAVLSVGVQWKREAAPVTVEAELWAAVPEQAAAPAPEEAPPPEPPKPPEPVVPPKPVPEPVAPPEPKATPNADIAIAKEKARQLKEKQAQQEKLALEKQKQARLEQEKQARDKLEKEKQQKLARDKKLQEQNAQKVDKAKAMAEAKKLEELRQQSLKRMADLAGSGGSGNAGSTSTALQSSGPSAAYAGRIRARIKPNITYIDTIVGNPTVEVEVRTSPDGTIISRKVAKASGVKSWDEAALNAIDKTGVLPRDENGRVPSPMIIVLSPQELIGR